MIKPHLKFNRYILAITSSFCIFTLFTSFTLLTTDDYSFSFFGFNRRINFCIRSASDIKDIISHVNNLPIGERAPLRCKGIDYVVVDEDQSFEIASQTSNKMYILGSNLGPELDRF